MGSLADYYLEQAMDRGEWFPTRPYVRSAPERTADASEFEDLTEDADPSPDDFSDLV